MAGISVCFFVTGNMKLYTLYSFFIRRIRRGLQYSTVLEWSKKKIFFWPLQYPYCTCALWIIFLYFLENYESYKLAQHSDEYWCIKKIIIYHHRKEKKQNVIFLLSRQCLDTLSIPIETTSWARGWF
jgi:hypothetical protein